jgi:hypothetical protein
MTDMIYNLDGVEVARELKATLLRVWGLQIASKMIMFRVNGGRAEWAIYWISSHR